MRNSSRSLPSVRSIYNHIWRIDISYFVDVAKLISRIHYELLQWIYSNRWNLFDANNCCKHERIDKLNLAGVILANILKSMELIYEYFGKNMQEILSWTGNRSSQHTNKNHSDITKHQRLQRKHSRNCQRNIRPSQKLKEFCQLVILNRLIIYFWH